MKKGFSLHNPHRSCNMAHRCSFAIVSAEGTHFLGWVVGSDLVFHFFKANSFKKKILFVLIQKPIFQIIWTQNVNLPQAKSVSVNGRLLYLPNKVKQLEVHGFRPLRGAVPILLQVVRGPCG